MLTTSSFLNLNVNRVGKSFTPRLSDPLGTATWYGIAASDTIVVAVTASTSIYYAYISDLTIWIKADIGNLSRGQYFSSQVYRGVTYNTYLKLFVAVGGAPSYGVPSISYSSDGIVWYDAKINVSTGYLRSVIFDSYGFIAVGDGGAIVMSSDGINWNTIYHTSGGTINRSICLASSLGMYVMVTDSGEILSSNDAINWTTRIVLYTIPFYSISYQKNIGKFFVGGNNSNLIYSSSDGINWSTFSLTYGSSANPPKITAMASSDTLTGFGASTGSTSFWNVGFLSNSNNLNDTAYYSCGDNLSYWSGATVKNTMPSIYAFYYIKSLNTFLIGGDSGALLLASGSSSNSMTITSVQDSLNKSNIFCRFLNGYFYALNASGRMMYSQDGVNWMRLTLNGPRNQSLMFVANNRIYTTQGSYLLYLDYPYTAYSSGLTYTPNITGVNYNNIAFIINKYYVADSNGNIYYSTDGVNFTSVTVYSSGYTVGNINSIAYGNNVYVAVGNSTLTSSDGINWYYANLFSNNGQLVIFGNGVFVAYDGVANILVSSNGGNWTSATTNPFAISGYTNKINDIIFAENRFIAVGYKYVSAGIYYSLVAESKDGVNWTVMNTKIGYKNVLTVTYGNKMLVFGCSDGYIETSP